MSPASIIQRVTVWARLVTVVAVIRVIIGLALYFSGQVFLNRPPPIPLAAYAVLTATFGILGLTLVATNRHDARATWLGGLFVLVAVPLGSPFLRNREIDDFGWLLFVRPDAFLPAFLWRFVDAFPVPLTGRRRRLADVFWKVAAGTATVISLVNLSYLVWRPIEESVDWRQRLRPIGGAGSLYYPLVFGLSSAAFAMLFWRARRAAPEDRSRIRVFTAGLLGGLAPFAVQAILDAIPGYNAFIHQPGRELIVGLVLFGALATVPFVTAYSVLFDRIVDLRVVLRAAVQYGLARYTILVAVIVPFVALILFVVKHKEESMTVLLSGPRPVALGAALAVGLIAVRLRQPLLDRLDRRYFREQYDARGMLDGLMTDSLRVVDAHDLETRLHAAIDRALHADASLYVAGDAPGVLVRTGNGQDPISTSSILVTLAGADTGPMDVDPSDDRSPFRRLPAGEQHWLMTTRAHLLMALRGADRQPLGLLALSSKRSGLPYSTDDRRLLSAVGASASLALDNVRLRSNPEPVTEPPARECMKCSRLNPPDAVTCVCEGALVTAHAPYVLRGIFRLDRRIGSGGMGVVYHARDLNLDRSVAIKTLPRMTQDEASHLRGEARAMAAVVHPNLAVIHGIETWQGVPFLIEEFLAGGSLADRLRLGPLGIDAALTLCATLAGALEQLHQAGIIHRDIKPSNIGFTQSGVVKLLDFGLARLMYRPTAPTDTTRGIGESAPAATFSEQAFVGTPPYMAPEALLGQHPRPSFDLWSLSVVLYESMTGDRPFKARDNQELKKAILAGDFVRPSAILDRDGEIIDAFFESAFATDQSRRHGNARSFLTAIRPLGAGQA